MNAGSLLNRQVVLSLAGTAAVLLSSCGNKFDASNKVLVSVRDQKMLLVKDGREFLRCLCVDQHLSSDGCSTQMLQCR